MENDGKKKLYIPTNALDNEDIIAGFGIKEARITAIVFVMCIVGAIFFIRSNEDYMLMALLTCGGIIAMVLSFIWRDQFDESLVEKLRQIYFYNFRLQKKYEYVYYDWLAEYVGILEVENVKKAG